MSRFGLAATLLIALASAACSSGETGTFTGPTTVGAPADPALSFAVNDCTRSMTGHGIGMQRCVAQEEQTARANGVPSSYVAELRAN